MIERIERKFNIANLIFFAEKMKNIEYFIFFGTLLGYHRENNIIEGDDDIDFYVKIENYNNIVQILQKEQIKISIKKETFIQAVRNLDGVITYIDFYFYQNNSDKDYIIEKWGFHGAPFNASSHLHVPKEIVFPIEKSNLSGIEIKIPKKVKECCEYLYGDTVDMRLKKGSEYVMNIVDNRPFIKITEPKVPIFIIVRDRLIALKECIKSYEDNIKTPFEIIIHDNGSTYGPTVDFLKKLENSGTKVYWSSVNDLREVNKSVKDWMSKNTKSKYFVITDPDVCLKDVHGDILVFYSNLLKSNSFASVVGPMLEINDIPDHYPKKVEVIQAHYYQFWRHTPTKIEYGGVSCDVQKAAIDSTFGMYRRGYIWNGPSVGIRTHVPYSAKHLDWYLNPDELSPDQEYYKETAASNIGGWGSNLLKHDKHPDFHPQYHSVDVKAAMADLKSRKKKEKILVIVPFYNVEQWIQKCIESIKDQKYENFSCVLIDDISTDDSYKKCIEVVGEDKRFTIIKNEEKKYALKNIIDGISSLSPDDEDVIITVDGDDWLYDERVFNKINNIYARKNCLITYGNYERYPDGKLGHCTKYPDHVVKNNLYRRDTWRASHLRTFKYKLWKNINNSDFLDENGEYLDVAWDLAFMFPMLEMAAERQAFINSPLYVYNMSNPNNDFKKKIEKQRMYDGMIRRRSKYERIE